MTCISLVEDLIVLGIRLGIVSVCLDKHNVQDDSGKGAE